MFTKTTIATILTILPIDQLWAQSFSLGTYVQAYNSMSGGDSSQQEMHKSGKLVDSISGGGAMAYSMAEASIGVLRASSSTQATLSEYFTYDAGSGSASATFSDWMQVDLHREGTTSGLLTVQLAVSGTVSSSRSSSEPVNGAWASANIRFLNYSNLSSSLDLYIDAHYDETTTIPHGTIFDVEIPFWDGWSFDFSVELNIESHSVVQTPGSASSLANFGGTVYWGGIKSVVVDGVTLDSSEYNISSGSGTDYTKSFAPIPEPEIYAAIFGLGLAAFGILRRRTDRPTRGRAALPRGPI